ncbi:MAG: CHAT domain-containing protein [Pseudonocardiales bacterium]
MHVDLDTLATALCIRIDDELTASPQITRWRPKVGTPWEIDDELAVRVANDFYTALATSDNTIDTTGAAQALHHAVRAIRDEQPATPSSWAAYLHAGA